MASSPPPAAPSLPMENTSSASLPLPKIGNRIEKQQICKAVDAVLKWERSRKNRQKAQLLHHDQVLYLIVSLKKHPEKVRINPFRIPIPYPLFSLDGAQDVCLFVNDRKGFTQKEAKQKLAEEKIPIAKVISLSKLKTDYVPFEAKRKLCGSYDLFLADKTILSSLPKLLGKSFFRKKKHPIPVDLTKKNWSKQIAAVCGSTFFYINSGTCSVLKVGRFSQTSDEIVENISAAIEGLASVIPRKWRNIRALYLKTLESVALPIFQALPEMPLKIDALQGELNMWHKPQSRDTLHKVGRCIGDAVQLDSSLIYNGLIDTDGPLSGSKVSSITKEGPRDSGVLELEGRSNAEATSSRKKRHKMNSEDAELERVEKIPKQKMQDFAAEKRTVVVKDPSVAQMNIASARRPNKLGGNLASVGLKVKKKRKNISFSKEGEVKKRGG